MAKTKNLKALKPLSEAFKKKAENVYYDTAHPAAYGSVKDLAEALGDKRGKKTRQWLQGQEPYTLHRPAPTRFKHRPTIASGPGVQLQADLMDVSSHASKNKGTRYLLTAIDAFSRFAWAVPVKNKTGEEIVKGLTLVLKNKSYRYLQTDKGREFRNEKVERFLKSKNVKWFSSENEVTKASIVERFNKTLRKKIHSHLTRVRSGEYIKDLQHFVDGYNKRTHSATGVAPVNVDATNSAQIFYRLYEPDEVPREKKDKLEVGQHVRTTLARGAFARGYREQWTREVFVVRAVHDGETPVVYEIEDLSGEEVLGTYYRAELQKVDEPEEFVIEEVLKTRGKGASKELFIKWAGYPSSFNSWIRASDAR